MHIHRLFPFLLNTSSPTLRDVGQSLPGDLSLQHTFSITSSSAEHTVPKGDPAGRPNLATRFEITSPINSTLFCAKEGDKHTSGYAHFTNALGEEDKHMFWTLFHAKNNSENAPVILNFGGGPGTSGMLVPFSGQGHCQAAPGPDGHGTAVPSDYPWTDFANILAVDYPVGTGFSYGERGSFRNSSERAAWDLDDLLQAFWRANPILAENQFAVSSGSYGGTYIPNLVNVIRDRNIHAKNIGNSSRLLKMPNTALMSNPYSDSVTKMRYSHVVSCDDFDFFNETICENIVRATPNCLDALQLAEEQPTIQNKLDAFEKDCAVVYSWDDPVSGKNPYDAREKCRGVDECFPSFKWVNNTMNDHRLREAFGVPQNVTYILLAGEENGIRFAQNGDLAQRAYKLLGPAVDDGMRLLVYSGIEDIVCPSRATEAWLRLLPTKHLYAFRGAPEVDWSGLGSFYSVGKGGAGEYAFVKVKEAGHFVVSQQPKNVQNLIRKWLRNEKFI